MSELTHLDSEGRPAMVDVSGKAVTLRTATARSIVWLPPEVMVLFREGEIVMKKGAVFQTAIIAGIMATKKTGELIPLCHPLGLENCSIVIDVVGNEAHILCTTRITAKTGVEMEALIGASVAALTIYDMCKALSHDIVIRETKLLNKTGGKSDYVNGAKT